MPLAVFLRHAQKKVTQERKKNGNYTNRKNTNRSTVIEWIECNMERKHYRSRELLNDD